MIKNEMIALTKSPTRNLLPFTTKVMFEKFRRMNEGRDQGSQQVFDKGSNDCPEGGAHYDSHRHVNNVAAQQKLLESVHELIQRSTILIIGVRDQFKAALLGRRSLRLILAARSFGAVRTSGPARSGGQSIAARFCSFAVGASALASAISL